MLKYISITILFAISFSSFSQTKVAVIGGGMAGVSVTHYLSQFDKEAEIVLFERAHILGGNAQTIYVENHAGEKVSVDAGPQYFADGAWEDYKSFLEETLGKDAYEVETMGELYWYKEKIKKNQCLFLRWE